MIATTIHHLAMVATVYELGISQGSHRRQAVERSRRFVRRSTICRWWLRGTILVSRRVATAAGGGAIAKICPTIHHL
ncbi:MAG: hypothetical protein ACKN9U_05770, partial [Pirellulaceae bacterium]